MADREIDIGTHTGAARPTLRLPMRRLSCYDVESEPGGSQILIDDPDGSPVELHEAAR